MLPIAAWQPSTATPPSRTLFVAQNQVLHSPSASLILSIVSTLTKPFFFQENLEPTAPQQATSPRTSPVVNATQTSILPCALVRTPNPVTPAPAAPRRTVASVTESPIKGATVALPSGASATALRCRSSIAARRRARTISAKRTFRLRSGVGVLRRTRWTSIRVLTRR